jgi:hypothetical protein
MKKFVSVLSFIVIISLMVAFPVYAESSQDNADLSQIITNAAQPAGTVTIEYLSDGSYFITTTTTNSSSNENGIQPLSSTKTGGKDVSYYSAADIKVFTYRVVGTFEYDGNTATCTKASSGLIYIHSDCQSTTYSAYASGNKAIGNISTYYHGVHITKTVTLTCDKNGNLS